MSAWDEYLRMRGTGGFSRLIPEGDEPLPRHGEMQMWNLNKLPRDDESHVSLRYFNVQPPRNPRRNSRRGTRRSDERRDHRRLGAAPVWALSLGQGWRRDVVLAGRNPRLIVGCDLGAGSGNGGAPSHRGEAMREWMFQWHPFATPAGYVMILLAHRPDGAIMELHPWRLSIVARDMWTFLWTGIEWALAAADGDGETTVMIRLPRVKP